MPWIKWIYRESIRNLLGHCQWISLKNNDTIPLNNEIKRPLKLGLLHWYIYRVYVASLGRKIDLVSTAGLLYEQLLTIRRCLYFNKTFGNLLLNSYNPTYIHRKWFVENF